LLCAQRFSCHINNVVDGHVNRIINRYVRNSVVDTQLQTACFVDEQINIRDNNNSSLSSSVAFTCTKIMDVIQLVRPGHDVKLHPNRVMSRA